MASPSKALEVYNEQVDESEEEDDDDEEQEEINTVSTAQRTNIGKADLRQCQGTHVGNSSEFHGPVKMKTVWKAMTTPQQQQQQQQLPSTSGNARPTAFSSSSMPSEMRGGGRPFRFLSEDLQQEDYNVISPCSVIEVGRRNGHLESNGDVESNPNSQLTSTEDIPGHYDEGIEETLLLNERNGRNGCKGNSVICYVSSLIGVILIVIVLIVGVYLYCKLYPRETDNLPMNFTERLVTRGEWFAHPPTAEMKLFKYNPVPYVVVCHTPQSRTCNTRRSCRVMVRNIQAGQMANGLYDIAFNFLVGGDGYIYEGRGWEEASAGTRPVNCSALSVAFIGNFVVNEPTLKQLDAFRVILQAGVNNSKLADNYKMFMQKQIVNTESPGEALIEILRTWSHWKPFTKQDLICNQTINNSGN